MCVIAQLRCCLRSEKLDQVALMARGGRLTNLCFLPTAKEAYEGPSLRPSLLPPVGLERELSPSVTDRLRRCLTLTTQPDANASRQPRSFYVWDKVATIKLACDLQGDCITTNTACLCRRGPQCRWNSTRMRLWMCAVTDQRATRCLAAE